MRRKRINRRKSRRIFQRGNRINRKNDHAIPLRGGFRL